MARSSNFIGGNTRIFQDDATIGITSDTDLLQLKDEELVVSGNVLLETKQLAAQVNAGINGIRECFTLDNTAYAVTDNSDTLVTIDIGNKSEPVFRGMITDGDDGSTFGNPSGVFALKVSNKIYAYVSSLSDNCLSVFDVTNPANIIYKGKISDGDGGGLVALSAPRGIFARIEGAKVIVYVAASASDALQIINATDPTAMTHEGKISDGDGGAVLNGAWDVEVDGNEAFVSAYTSKSLEIVNVADTTSPTHKSEISDGDGGAGLDGARGVSYLENVVYVVANVTKCLQLINVTDRDNPVYLSRVDDGDEGGLVQLDGLWDVTARKETSYIYVYITVIGDDALQIMDATNPTATVHKGRINNGDGGARLDAPLGLSIIRDMACVAADFSSTFTVVDIADPANPSLAGDVVNGDAAVGEIWSTDSHATLPDNVLMITV